MTKMKIVFLSENVSWGGSELLWSKTVVEMVKFNFDVIVCVPEKLILPDYLKSLQIENKIVITRIETKKLSFAYKILNKFSPYNYQKKPKNKTFDFLANLQFDLIVINQGYNFNSVDYMNFAHQNNLKYVTISHALNEHFWPNLSLRHKMIDGFRNSVMNYFVSTDNLETTELQLGERLLRAEVIRNPFNVEYNRLLDYPKAETYNLAFVGRYEFHAKGQDALLRVLSLEKWKNRNLIVNFYGEGKDIENLKDINKMFDLRNAIFHNQTKTAEIWKHNQALILTSRFEGLPIVIVEAMLCSRFAIVSDVSGNAELITDNKTGFIATAPRPLAIDEALERAWNVRDIWESIGQEARLSIVNRIPEFPERVFAEKVMSLINV